MGKLYFNYSTMNAGKSTALLQAAFNYQSAACRRSADGAARPPLRHRQDRGARRARGGRGRSATTTSSPKSPPSRRRGRSCASSSTSRNSSEGAGVALARGRRSPPAGDVLRAARRLPRRAFPGSPRSRARRRDARGARSATAQEGDDGRAHRRGGPRARRRRADLRRRQRALRLALPPPLPPRDENARLRGVRDAGAGRKGRRRASASTPPSRSTSTTSPTPRRAGARRCEVSEAAPTVLRLISLISLWRLPPCR